MRQKNQPRTSGAARQGQPWRRSEQKILVRAYNLGTPLHELANRHGRSLSAIASRLVQNGLLDPGGGPALVPDEAVPRDHLPWTWRELELLTDLWEAGYTDIGALGRILRRSHAGIAFGLAADITPDGPPSLDESICSWIGHHALSVLRRPHGPYNENQPDNPGLSLARSATEDLESDDSPSCPSTEQYDVVSYEPHGDYEEDPTSEEAAYDVSLDDLDSADFEDMLGGPDDTFLEKKYADDYYDSGDAYHDYGYTVLIDDDEGIDDPPHRDNDNRRPHTVDKRVIAWIPNNAGCPIFAEIGNPSRPHSIEMILGIPADVFGLKSCPFDPDGTEPAEEYDKFDPFSTFPPEKQEERLTEIGRALDIIIAERPHDIVSAIISYFRWENEFREEEPDDRDDDDMDGIPF